MKNIVSVTADSKGRATIYRRNDGEVTQATQRFSNWIVSQNTSNIKSNCEIVELDGDLPFRWLTKTQNVNRIAGKFDYKEIIKYNNTQQYLITSGNSYFGDMEFQELYRLQFDLETTTKNPKYISNAEYDEIYMIAVSDTEGYEEVITGSEAEIIQRLIEIILEKDPDVIENHNIFGFDLSFLCKRAKKHGIKLTLGRDGSTIWSYEDSVKIGGKSEKFTRYCINGREIIDTMFLTRRHIHSLRSRGYGLKNTAKYLGVASKERTYIKGDKIYDTWKKNKEVVERYALDDVREARAISDELLPIDFELTKIFPDKLEKVATAGTATMIDMLLVKEYLNASHSIPKATTKKQKYAGGLTEVYRKGILHDIVKADVSSMYPSIMLTHHIKPDHDPMNIFTNQLQNLTNKRLEAKSKLKSLHENSSEYKATDAYQQAVKLIINSFYGLLGTGYTSFHFNSPSGAEKVTAIGRDILERMLKAGEQLNGIPVESDTDGIFFAGVAEDKGIEFVNSINKQLDKEGITIDFDGYWKSMYSYGKKNYTLIDSEGNLTLKGIFNSGDEERFISETKINILQHLFNGNLERIKQSYADNLEAITQGKLTIDDITKRQRLSKDLVSYSDQTTATHVKALFNAGIEDAEQGYLVEYYKSPEGWKLKSGFDGTYDVKHYQDRFHSAIDRTFQYALNESDRQVLFSDQQLSINLNAISPQATETNVEPAVIDISKAEAWIELSFGNTLKGIDAPDRWNWTRIDDIDGIRDFVEKHDHLDVHRSNVAYFADTVPVQADLSRYKQVGAFFLEVEGKNYEKDLQGNDIIDDRNDIVVSCARNVMDILIDLGVEKDDIVAYYNGGKSIYIYLPMGYICAEPRFKLNDIYQKITEDLIIPELPEKYQSLIDTQIYQFKHSLRLLNTKHHKGKFGYRVEANDLYQENWEDLTNREGKAKITPTFSPPPIIPKDDSQVIKELGKIANKVTNTPQASSSEKKRESKAKQYRDNTRQIEYILSNINPDYITPCIRNIAIAIRDKGSIGFGGRNKFIAEMLILGRAQGLTDREIENEICKVFLNNDNPNRYAVMEADNRDNPNPSGYRLKNNYFDIDKLETFDPTCKTCQEFCEPAKCYRHQQFKTEVKPTLFKDFITTGRKKTAEAITAEPATNQITAVDASLSSGKTYQISKKAVEQANQNELSVIFTHSHNASQEVCDNVSRFGLETGVCVHMRGKSEATCYQEHRNCKSCQYRGDFFSSDKETREQARQQLVTECQCRVIDLQEAQALAEKYEVCPFVIMRALAITMRDGIVTTNHNYLGDVNLHPILNRIKSDYYFVDEADQLITNMMRYQQKMTIAKTRSNLRHTYQKSCGNQCDKCNIHFADCWSRGLDTREHIKSQEQEDTQNPENFIDTLRHAVETVNLLDAGIIHDIFDHDALSTNIERLEQVLSLMNTDCTPYEAITELEKSLINSDLDFIEVDKIYEGRTTYDGKVIFPDENIVSIKMENPIDTDTLAMMLDPDPDAVDELQFGNRQLNYHSLFIDSGEKTQIRGTETEEAIKICLAFTNLIEEGGCQVGLYFETRRVDEDKTIPNRKQNIMSCGLSLRVFDIDGFQAVTDKMKRNNTLLLSGTFLSREMLAKSLLLPETDIDYNDKTLPMHDKFLIIHTDAKGSKSTNGVKVSNLSNSHLTKIYRRVAELLDEVHILNFEKNTNQGSIFFFNLNNDEEHNKDFYIENLCSRTPQIADWCIYESSDDRKRTITVDKLVIDKLRSSRARAVNRGVFDICTVNGNGYVNWYDFLPYVKKMRDMVDPELQLDDLFEYDRRKVVAQAITRAPRDENRTVGLYFGDMPYIDYPEYLKPCVVLLDEILSELKEARPDVFICNIDNQIEITAQVIVAFIKGEVTHDDFSAVFDKIEFVGEYEGGKREARKVEVDLSGLTEVEQYAVMSFVEKYKRDADNAKVINAVAGKLKHINNCVAESGSLDKREDRKGNYSDWKDLINHLVEIGYLIQKEITVKTGNKKTIFVKNDN